MLKYFSHRSHTGREASDTKNPPKSYRTKLTRNKIQNTEAMPYINYCYILFLWIMIIIMAIVNNSLSNSHISKITQNDSMIIIRDYKRTCNNVSTPKFTSYHRQNKGHGYKKVSNGSHTNTSTDGKSQRHR